MGMIKHARTAQNNSDCSSDVCHRIAVCLNKGPDKTTCILKKNEGHWTRKTLETLERHDIGWAKQKQDNLREWGLEMDWDIIRAKENGRD